MRTMHLFAGIGGGLYADLVLGHEPVVAVEQDRYCCEVLRERASDGWFPGLRVWEGDIGLFDPSEYKGKVDCIAAGFPCQNISTAGKGAGLAGEQSRLFFEVIRIGGAIRPQHIFLENVPAILVRGIDRVLGALVEIGYNCRWTILSAAETGAPHWRKRWWCIATNTDRAMRSKQWRSRAAKKKVPATGCDSWWKAEPGFCRVGDGIPNQLNRIKGLGNAQVPLQAALAWTVLVEKDMNL